MPLERFRPNEMPRAGLAFRAACRALLEGGLVAFPTDTVYGLGADPRCPEAVQRLFVAKGRPEDRTIPLLVVPRRNPPVDASPVYPGAVALSEDDER